jgi:hypothetical protein
MSREHSLTVGTLLHGPENTCEVLPDAPSFSAAWLRKAHRVQELQPLGDIRLQILRLVVDQDCEGIDISLSRLRLSLDDSIERSVARLMDLSTLRQVGI